MKKSSAAGSNSPKAQKHSIKSSLFSLFERKNSPDESHSSFYVDLNQEPQSEKINQSQPALDTQKLDNSQSEALIQLGLDPVVSSQESANILRVDNSPLTSHGTSVAVQGATLLDVLEVPTVPAYQGLSPGSASQGYKPSLNSGATGTLLYFLEIATIYELGHKKTSLQGFRPGLTQIGMCSYRRWIEA